MQIVKIVSNFLESNSFVIIDNNEFLLIDAGVEVENVKKVVGNAKCDGILLTHGHFDHAINVVKLSKMFNCKIYASVKAQETLSDAKKNYGDNFAINDFSNFVTIGEGNLKLGEFNVNVFSLTGHSQCSLGFLIDGHLFVGDVVFEHGIGRIDLFGGSKQEMLTSLKKISDMQFEYLHSGHGEDSTKPSQSRNLSTFIRFLSR